MDQRKWSESECMAWFIRQDRGKLTELSELSGVPYGTLKRWRKSGDWVRRRAEYRAELAQELHTRAIDQTSKSLLQDWKNLEALAREHFEALRLCRELVEQRLRIVESDVEALQTKAQLQSSLGLSTEQIDNQIVERVDLGALLSMSQTLDRCIRGERLCLSMEYLDLNNAIARIESTGLKVIAPNDATLREVERG